jgi:hypothetical protein
MYMLVAILFITVFCKKFPDLMQTRIWLHTFNLIIGLLDTASKPSTSGEPTHLLKEKTNL